MITIINYGLGNIGAFTNAFKRMNIPTRIASKATDLDGATHVILPGVGSFDHAIELLNQSGMREPLDHLVQCGNIPILGICVGMQILADSSEEGVLPGLGWVGGCVRSFSNNPKSSSLPMPHMGWNDLKYSKESAITRNLEKDTRFYFLHSFYFECADDNHAIAHSDYGFDFTCAVRKGNVFGVQFHPEKSHHWGATLLKNFAEI